MDKESYEGYYRKIHMQLLETFVKKGGDSVRDMRSGNLSAWAKENEPELYKEMNDLENGEIHCLWMEGAAMEKFDNCHFEKFQDVVRSYGNVVNKIFNRYIKAMNAECGNRNAECGIKGRTGAGGNESMTKIEWADESVNPSVGCSKISAGCENCYALRMAWRLSHNPNPKIADKYKGTVEKVTGKVRWTGQINYDMDCMEGLFKGNKGKVVFVGSMGDIAHENLSYDRFAEILDECYSINDHRLHYSDGKKESHKFLFLTKRPQRFLMLWATYFEQYSEEEWQLIPKHSPVYRTFGVGTSIEDQPTANVRVPLLLRIPATFHFVSGEPLLGPIDLRDPAYASGRLAETEGIGLDLFICGGESGTGARPVHPDWVRGLRDQCRSAGVPFMFKQWGGWLDLQDATNRPDISPEKLGRAKIHYFEDGTEMLKIGKKPAGRMLDGREHLEMPR